MDKESIDCDVEKVKLKLLEKLESDSLHVTSEAECNVVTQDHTATNDLDKDCTITNGDNQTLPSLDLSSPILAMEIKWDFKSKQDNFTKGCKWSPDGLCLLVASEDKHVRLYNLPTQVADGSFQNESWFRGDWKVYSQPAIDVQERELIYDYSWYPQMKSNDRQTCCFATTSRDLPIHLWDAWTGDLVCSYSYYNHLDQLTAANSIGFSTDGSSILAGFNKKVCIFHTARPGRQCVIYNNKDHNGIISCFASHPRLPNIFAAGSYNGTIGFYTHNHKKIFLRLDGHKGGITHMMFSKDGTKLFSGARMDNDILCWDIRNPGNVLYTMPRIVENNQRILFDFDPQDKHLISGSTTSKLFIWDLENISEEENLPKVSFSPHNDSVNGVSFHPDYPILATSSGQRHFPQINTGSDSEDQDAHFSWKTVKPESSVKLWYFG